MTDLCRERGLDFASFDNWIPLIESEFCTGDRFIGIRGRSIEEDVTLWYILDTEANTTHGPFHTEDEYWQACYDLKAYPIGTWEPTKK